MAERSSAPKAEDRGHRKTFQGVVISDKMAKTRVVAVERLVRHGFYEKVMRKTSHFVAHDEDNSSHEGDLVEIMSTRPLSKTKRWRLVRILKTTPRVQVQAQETPAA